MYSQKTEKKRIVQHCVRKNVAWVRFLPVRSSTPPPPTATRGITTAATPMPTFKIVQALRVAIFLSKQNQL